MIRTTTLVIASLALLSACAGKSIEPSYYLLRPSVEMESRVMSPSTKFALGKIVIAPYLDQPGLLLETSDGQIRAARHNLWAEPMYEGVHSYMVKEISRARGEDILPARLVPQATVVELRIDQLHGTDNGEAKLVAYWWLRHDNEIESAYQFSESETLGADGYEALVNAERKLLTRLAEAIADTMKSPT